MSFEGKLFFAGSSEMFGETQSKAKITHPHDPKSPYALAKQTSFKMVKLYREIYNIKCITGVLFNHESQFRSKNFITQKIVTGAIECRKNKNHKIKIGNINVHRDWGWAEEYIEAIQLMVKAKSLKDQIICTGELNSLEEFIYVTFDQLNLNYKNHIIFDKKLFREADINRSFGDPKPIQDDLGWKAKFHMKEVIEKLIYYQLKGH